jgi:hypothetical protein
MKPIPNTENALVLRADFSDDAVWKSICEEITAPVGEYQAYVEFLSDPAYEGATIEQLVSLLPQGSGHTFIFVVDATTVSHPEHPVLCIDLYDEPGRSFRVLPPQMQVVENNLSTANLSFYEFADFVDEDGIYAGYA